jgi:hypothetical protein
VENPDGNRHGIGGRLRIGVRSRPTARGATLHAVVLVVEAPRQSWIRGSPVRYTPPFDPAFVRRLAEKPDAYPRATGAVPG